MSKDLVKEGIKKNLDSDFKNALNILNKAIDYDNANAEAYFNRGNVNFNLFDYKAAMADFDKAIELNQNYADAYYNRGNLEFILGNKDSACADYKRSEKLGKVNIKDNTRWCN